MTDRSLISRPPTTLGIGPRVCDQLFSGVDLLPSPLDLFGIEIPPDVAGPRILIERTEAYVEAGDRLQAMKQGRRCRSRAAIRYRRAGLVPKAPDMMAA